MTIALCSLSFTLGIIAIDLFCDHYVFVNPSLTSGQIETCTAFNRNVLEQPWYMVLVATLPTFLGIIIMLKNTKRSIYDTISVPLILILIGIFIFQINPSRESLFKTSKADVTIREGHLQRLAYSHATIAGLLCVLIILQILAENTMKAVPLKKKDA